MMYELDEDGCLAQRRLSDQRLLSVAPQTFGCAMLGIGEFPPLHTVGVYANFWDFPSRAAAMEAFETWDPTKEPEPTGWHRHQRTGRYRIDGNPDLEYVRSDGTLEEQARHAILVVGPGGLEITDFEELDMMGLREKFPEPLRSNLHCFQIMSEHHFEGKTCYHADLVYHYLDHSVVLSVPKDMVYGNVDNLFRRIVGR